MAFFKQRKHDIPALNTASLPDLIFTILFFFMLVTHMRKSNVMVKFQEPQGTELTKLVKRSSIDYIYIGKPTDAQGKILGEEDRIQLNDGYASIDEIKNYLIQEYRSLSPEQRKLMVVNIKADENVQMGTIIDLKKALREANALNVFYSAVNKKK